MSVWHGNTGYPTIDELFPGQGSLRTPTVIDASYANGQMSENEAKSISRLS